VRRVTPRVVPQGNTQLGNGNGAASEPVGSSGGVGSGHGPRIKPTDLSVIPTGAKRAEMFKNIERAPEIISFI
jgi:hypothetical protein